MRPYLVRLGRRLVLPLALAAIVWAASRSGRVAGAVALVAALVLLATIYIVLPRLAHTAFERGNCERARLYYRLNRLFIASSAARGAIDVSLAGCRLARSDFRGALADLERVRPEDLNPAARAAWLNNRAYALARGGGDGQEALAAVDDAVALRPDVAGFRHTRGVVLIALDRLDDAIAELDEVWRQVATDDVPPLLEAERCYDLARAWAMKGEPEYARDYLRRAQAVAPHSPWAARASAQVVSSPAQSTTEPRRASTE